MQSKVSFTPSFALELLVITVLLQSSALNSTCLIDFVIIPMHHTSYYRFECFDTLIKTPRSRYFAIEAIQKYLMNRMSRITINGIFMTRPPFNILGIDMANR